MAEAQELAIIAKAENPTLNINGTQQVITVSSSSGNHKKGLLRKILYIIFVLCGQSSASLLGRLYYEKGGSKKWVAAVVQLAGFPILIPFYCYISLSKSNNGGNDVITTPTPTPSIRKKALVYVTLGLITAAIAFLYSVALEYLSVSTVALITASQLAFNAFFSFFINSQKFTPFIINSLLLLTISSILLVFQDNTDRLPGVSHAKYAVGFICAIFSSAGTGLLLSLQQLALQKILKIQSFKNVMTMVIWTSSVALCAVLVGFFASGEWKGLNTEMKEYELGNVSYVMVLVWTAICWALFLLGTVGLVFEVSGLFCNSISTVGLPIVPIASVFVFHDKMSGVKAISLVPAIWGFISYAYQHYLDKYHPKAEEGKTSAISEANSTTLCNSTRLVVDP